MRKQNRGQLVSRTESRTEGRVSDALVMLRDITDIDAIMIRKKQYEMGSGL